MNELKIGDKVKTEDGKVGKITYYNNWVYSVRIGKEENLYGKGELEKI